MDKSLQHVWLQVSRVSAKAVVRFSDVSVFLKDYETWCDLRHLEAQVGVRYVTHESDDGRWKRHAPADGV